MVSPIPTTAESKYKTINGKELTIVGCKGNPHKKVQFTSGGELPAELSGMFTSDRFAEQAIISYLAKGKNAPSKV